MTMGFWTINSQRLLLHYKHKIYDLPINKDYKYLYDKPGATHSNDWGSLAIYLYEKLGAAHLDDSDGPEKILSHIESQDYLVDIDT